jgi:hypothetical protein
VFDGCCTLFVCVKSFFLEVSSCVAVLSKNVNTKVKMERLRQNGE